MTKRRTHISRCSWFLAAMGALGSSALAQPQQPPPAPDAPVAKAQNPPDNQVPAEVGKTKLEKETGTVNDRIFEVMPNYGTVEQAHELPPISSGQKFRLATAGVFDYFTFPFIGALAAIDQANAEVATASDELHRAEARIRATTRWVKESLRTERFTPWTVCL